MALPESKYKLLTILAGPASVVMVLAIVTLAALVCAPVLHSDKEIATEVAMRVVSQRANAVAQSLLIQPASALPADFEPADHSFRARHLPGVLVDTSATLPESEFVAKAVQKLRAQPHESARTVYEIQGKLHYQYMVADRAGGALWIDLPIDYEREAVGRGFGHSYIALTTAAYVLLLLLLFAGFLLRTQLRAIAQLPDAVRQNEIAQVLGQTPRSSRNLLPWMLALNTGLFAAEATGHFQNLSGIGYVLAVVLSLSSNRPWHVLAVAGYGALLTMLAPLLSPYSPHWWTHLESQPVTIFALIAIGLFGSNHLRKAASESRALARMIQAQQENAATRDALARAERAETERVKMLERMSLAIECAGISIWEWDVSRSIVHATEGSPYSIRMGGKTEVTVEEANGIIHPDDLAAYQGVFVAALDPASPTSLITHRHRIFAPNGEVRHIEFYGRVFRKPDGRVIRMLGIDWDITTEIEAGRALVRASEAAEEASRAKSSFLATMSHEIRTPMNGIIGMTGLLLESSLDRTQREYAETVRSSADSLLTILNDILDFSKIEAGKLEIESLELDLCSNVEEVGAIMAFQAAAKDLELIVNVRPDVPETVLGDPQRIRQCLLNLVGNAIKFTTRGEVLVEVFSVGHKDGRPLVHFEVRDTGMGIPPDTLNRLFIPFTQADSSTTRRFGGTGLGLSIVRRLVELMGGTAGAESEVGKGSAFWFTLPLEPGASVKTPSAEKPRLSRGNLLLVDDNATNRRVLASQLEHAGYDVVVTSAPREVVALVRNAAPSFDIVLLDYQMPSLDGEALGRIILNAKDLPPTRLVLLTSLDHGGSDTQKFAEMGFAAYLTKPIRNRELLACLDKVLAREAEPWNMRSQPIITRGTLLAQKERARLNGSVLLVEDNAINQRVAQRFLERLGCRVDIAGDGALGVEAYRTGKFDLILMDMQMPVMDGIEATQRIREIEGGASRIPIVALTANAMMGQLERCLAAGMDDYLTKPLDIQRLEDTLERFLKARGEGQTDLVPDAAKEAPQAMTDSMLTRLRDIADGDIEFMQELVTTFASAGIETVGELRTAYKANDLAALGRAAHKLKGACANLYIEPLATYALELESRAKENKSANWSELVERVATEFERVSQVLQDGIARESEAKRAG